MSNLDRRLIPGVDFTRRDEITFDLVYVTKCPIHIEPSNDVVIFNHQFYDRNSFREHQRWERINDQKRVRDGDDAVLTP